MRENGCGMWLWIFLGIPGASRRIGASGIPWDTRDGRPQVSPLSIREGTRGAVPRAFLWSLGSSRAGFSPGMRIPEGKGIPGALG